MKDIAQYSDLIDMLFKIGALFVALYMAPIKKDISRMSDEMRGLQDSVNTLNQNMALIFEKHENKVKVVDELQKDVRAVRERLHDITNKHLVRIQENKIRLDRIERGE